MSVRSWLLQQIGLADRRANERHLAIMSKLTALQTATDLLTAAVAARPDLDNDPRLDAIKAQIDAATAQLTPAPALAPPVAA